MTQFTKFTNLPIHTDLFRTPITNILISDIPVEKVLDSENGSLVSYRIPKGDPDNYCDTDVYLLYTKQVLPNRNKVFICECDDGWSVTEDSIKTGLRTYEKSDGSWNTSKPDSADPAQHILILSHDVELGEIEHLGTRIILGDDLDYRRKQDTYVFNVPNWVAKCIEKFGKIKLEEEHYFTKAVGNKDEMVATIEHLMTELSNVRAEIIKHSENKK
jgi:hypothetical protein